MIGVRAQRRETIVERCASSPETGPAQLRGGPTGSHRVVIVHQNVHEQIQHDRNPLAGAVVMELAPAENKSAAEMNGLRRDTARCQRQVLTREASKVL